MSIAKKKSKNVNSGGSFRLLCIGDIHLGRRPTRIPENIEEFGVSKASLTPVAAWNSVVAWAIEQHVDAVVLAGDVVEGLDDRFEAYTHLESGVRKLDRENIKIIGVAGNHDVEALPRLAKHINEFKLLGQGGNWESIDLEAESGAKIRLLGWSFPEQRVSRNPLDDLLEEIDGEVPTIGVLHCDVDGGNSVYAPVPRSAFDQVPVTAWLLGHIHKPSDLSGKRPVGYLGSLVALDSGEAGLHGPWLAEVSKAGSINLTQIPLAPLRFEKLELDIESIPDLAGDDLEDAIASALRSSLDLVRDRIRSTLGQTCAVGCRVILVGRASVHERMRRILSNSDFAIGQVRVHDDVVYFIEKILDRSAPALDLAEIAKGNDPPALLARRIIDLNHNRSDVSDLIASASKEIEKVTDEVLGPYRSDDKILSETDVVTLLVQAGYEALEDLLGQRNTGDGGEK